MAGNWIIAEPPAGSFREKAAPFLSCRKAFATARDHHRSSFMSGSHEPAVTDGYHDSKVELWYALNKRKWWLILFAIVGASLGYLYFLQKKPVYESTARILLKNNAVTLPVAGFETASSWGTEKINTQIILIRSPLVAKRAVETHKLGDLESLQGVGDISSAVLASLTVKLVDRAAEALDLTVRGTNPEDTAQILNAILESYKHYIGESQQNVSKETVNLISEAKDVLLDQLEKKEAAYRTFRQESPLMWKGKEATNLHQDRLYQIEKSCSDLILQRADLEAQVAAIDEALAKGTRRDAIMMTIDRHVASQTQAAVDQARANLFPSELLPLLAQEQLLLEKFGPKHPEVLSVQKRLALTRNFLKNQMEELSSKEKAAEKTVVVEDRLANYLDSIQQELATIKKKETLLAELSDREREAAKNLSLSEITDGAMRNDIAHTQQLFDSVVKRLGEISLIKDMGGVSVQIVAPAGLGAQATSRMPAYLLVGGALGLLLGAGLAYLVEAADSSFRGPDDIRVQTGIPVVGHVPRMEEQPKSAASESPLSPALCAYFRPQAHESEAYRAVRTSLYFHMRGKDHKIIQVTSPSPGDGKSTLAANLSVSIAQSGRRILLLDADIRRPQVHKLFGLKAERGLCEILKGTAEPNDVIYPSTVENLDLLPCGKLPRNPAELLSSDRFQELLDLLRDRYEFVIIDSPPMLAVTDASIVAARVDTVLMTLKLTRHSRRNLDMSRQMLDNVSAHIAGIVVNFVGGKQRDAYQYGANYGYGYGRPYGKSKSRGKSYRSYYVSDEPSGLFEPAPAGSASVPARAEDDGQQNA